MFLPFLIESWNEKAVIIWIIVSIVQDAENGDENEMEVVDNAHWEWEYVESRLAVTWVGGQGIVVVTTNSKHPNASCTIETQTVHVQ